MTMATLKQIILKIIVYVLYLSHISHSKPNYCLPTDNKCWPTQKEINEFELELNGILLTSNDINNTEYMIYVNMTQNPLYRNQYPSFIVVCESVQDIQESILFASYHTIQISIMSTGHSWSGRSTANNSLQINFVN